MMTPAARAALMATFSMGWIDEEEAIMGVGSRPVLCAEVLREKPKKHARQSGRRQWPSF
jgi:hypothetical protein